MANALIASAIGNFKAAARSIGLDIPAPIAAALDPAAHPRAQLHEHLGGIPSIPEAIHAALNAGKNPATDKGVAEALKARQIWAGSGDLDAVQEQRIAAALREHWDALAEAVDAIYTPAAQAFTDAHALLKRHGIDPNDRDAIIRHGGDVLAAWADATGRLTVYRKTGAVMSQAAAIIAHGNTGNRKHWTTVPNLDTWTREQPDASDPWAVLDSGATLSLARTRTEAEQRATLVHRERELARAARQGLASSGGFGLAPNSEVTYLGADGTRRTTDMHGTIRTAGNVGAPVNYDDLSA